MFHLERMMPLDLPLGPSSSKGAWMEWCKAGGGGYEQWDRPHPRNKGTTAAEIGVAPPSAADRPRSPSCSGTLGRMTALPRKSLPCLKRLPASAGPLVHVVQ